MYSITSVSACSEESCMRRRVQTFDWQCVYLHTLEEGARTSDASAHTFYSSYFFCHNNFLCHCIWGKCWITVRKPGQHFVLIISPPFLHWSPVPDHQTWACTRGKKKAGVWGPGCPAAEVCLTDLFARQSPLLSPRLLLLPPVCISRTKWMGDIPIWFPVQF